MTYKEQYKEIENLLNRIKIKTRNFSEIEKNPNFDDLSFILDELKDIDDFINDKYYGKN